MVVFEEREAAADGFQAAGLGHEDFPEVRSERVEGPGVWGVGVGADVLLAELAKVEVEWRSSRNHLIDTRNW